MKKVIKIIIFLIIGIWIMINLFSSLGMSIFGMRIFRIGLGSMEPKLKINDLIIIKEDNYYNIGDIIAFEDDGNYIVHRIVKIEDDKITTKGDNNNLEDLSISKDKIIGKMIYNLGFFSFLIFLFSQKSTWIVIFIISIIIIFGISVKTDVKNKTEN